MGFKSPLDVLKQGIARAGAGVYDEEAVRADVNRYISGSNVVVFSWTRCPFCKKAKGLLQDLLPNNSDYQFVELDERDDGNAIRYELSQITGRTSVPQIWINGEFVGGCNDGPGVFTLMDRGDLVPKLEAAGCTLKANSCIRHSFNVRVLVFSGEFAKISTCGKGGRRPDGQAFAEENFVVNRRQRRQRMVRIVHFMFKEEREGKTNAGGHVADFAFLTSALIELIAGAPRKIHHVISPFVDISARPVREGVDERMAYFIGNGSATIGGGSLGRTEQMPSLKLRCLDLCARHLDRLSNLGDMPTEMFIDLLNRAKGKATPELVQRLQDVNERLLCEEVDEAYWKLAVEGHILRRTVPAPGPVLVERVNDHKEVAEIICLLHDAILPAYVQHLLELMERTPSTPSKEWSREVTAILKALEETPACVGLLRETMIGKAVAPLRKCADAQVARLTSDIIRGWKDGAKSAGPDQQKAPGVSTALRDAGRGAGGDAERRTSDEKRRAMEEGFRCRTWNALYKHLELLRAEKVRASSRRAREAREREQQKKPKMIMGKSRGEDFLRRRAAKSQGIPTSQCVKSPPSRYNSSAGSAGAGARSSGGSSGSVTPDFAGRSAKTGSGGGSRGTKSTGGSARGNSGTSNRSGGVSKLTELRRQVAMGQRLSTPVSSAKRGTNSNSGQPSAKRSKFWK